MCPLSLIQICITNFSSFILFLFCEFRQFASPVGLAVYENKIFVADTNKSKATSVNGHSTIHTQPTF